MITITLFRIYSPLSYHLNSPQSSFISTISQKTRPPHFLFSWKSGGSSFFGSINCGVKTRSGGVEPLQLPRQIGPWVLQKCAVSKDICAVPSRKMCSPERWKTDLGGVFAETLRKNASKSFLFAQAWARITKMLQVFDQHIRYRRPVASTTLRSKSLAKAGRGKSSFLFWWL